MVQAVVAEVSHQGPVPEDLNVSCAVSLAAARESSRKGTSAAEETGSIKEKRSEGG